MLFPSIMSPFPYLSLNFFILSLYLSAFSCSIFIPPFLAAAISGSSIYYYSIWLGYSLSTILIACLFYYFLLCINIFFMLMKSYLPIKLRSIFLVYWISCWNCKTSMFSLNYLVVWFIFTRMSSFILSILLLNKFWILSPFALLLVLWTPSYKVCWYLTNPSFRSNEAISSDN